MAPGPRTAHTHVAPGTWPAELKLAALPLLEEMDMEKDVVCGMRVDPAKAAGTSQHNGKTYYFCSTGCKAKFDANPQQYTNK